MGTLHEKNDLNFKVYCDGSEASEVLIETALANGFRWDSFCTLSKSDFAYGLWITTGTIDMFYEEEDFDKCLDPSISFMDALTLLSKVTNK